MLVGIGPRNGLSHPEMFLPSQSCIWSRYIRFTKSWIHEEELFVHNAYRVSRITSIYGANGSGKTTLIDAVGYMKFLVKECTKFQDGDKIPRVSHKLSGDVPTTFDVQFVVDGVRYAYGFSVNDEFVQEAYLYHFPAGKQAKVFERNRMEFTFGANYRKELKEII